MEVGTAKESHPVRAVNRACGPFLLLLVASCAGGPGGAPEPGSRADDLLLLNRVTWGANPSSARELARMGPARYLAAQLQPAKEAALPPEVQAQVDAMTISQRRVDELAKEMESRRKGLDLLRSDDEKKAAQQAYQQELTRLGREAAARMLLRALYSPWQLREQMTWFWMNHFNVFQYKANLRVLVADYEERAIRQCARALPRAARRDGAAPGDAHLPGQRAERRQPDQRELRPRADGAAHARHRRRLHPARRAGARAHPHRLQRQLRPRNAEVHPGTP